MTLMQQIADVMERVIRNSESLALDNEKDRRILHMDLYMAVRRILQPPRRRR